MSKKDKNFYEKFESNLSFDGERYCVRLPFTESLNQIPDNYSNSFFRSKNLKVKLQNNDELNKNYCRVLDEYESQGIIEKTEHIADPAGVHYLPHRAMVKSKKETSKIRIVFDGSSYLKNELSINEFLEPGPCLLPLLYDVLLRLCLRSIGIIADIRHAFLQISVDPSHSDYLRFLWLNFDSDDPDFYIYRFSRVLFGLTCPFKRDFEASFSVRLDSKYVCKIHIRKAVARFVCR